MTGRTTTWMKTLAAVAAAAAMTAARAAPGDGIRLGGSEAHLHPFLDLETRYDSNVTYTPADKAVGDLILHVKPGLEISAPSDAASLEFNGKLDWAQYLGVDGDTSSLSKLYGDANLAVLFNRKGSVTPRLDNVFVRDVSTNSLSAAAFPVVSNRNTLSLAVPYKPGGGAMVFSAIGRWFSESFGEYQDLTPAQADQVSKSAYDEFRVGGEVEWRFLPRTTGLLQAGYLSRVPRSTDRPDEATGYDVLAGVTGLMTPRIAGTAKVGFGSTNVARVPVGGTSADTSTFLTDLSVEWLPIETLSVRGGYARTLGLDPTLSTYIADSLSAGLKLKMADRVAARIGVRWDRFTFQGYDATSTTYLRIDPEVEGLFGRWLRAAVGYTYSSKDASWPAPTPPPVYSKNEVYLRVGLTY